MTERQASKVRDLMDRRKEYEMELGIWNWHLQNKKNLAYKGWLLGPCVLNSRISDDGYAKIVSMAKDDLRASIERINKKISEI